ncbi:unnamed protein product [Phytophthora lilii]|uniref:Unnamed protein product n=1 Tax=Phytophthora lilii TaxID=2077276 RepID=A0A9W6U2D4_9STRA|nr:unnamed protein product [Phytophthora lilii]
MNVVLREAKELQLMRTEDEPEVQVATLVPPVHEERHTEQVQEESTNPHTTIDQAEEHARSVKMLPAHEKKKRRLKCVGWRATGHCTTHGPVNLRMTKAATMLSQFGLRELANTSEAGDMSFHRINDHWATGFGAKVFAIYSSFFDRVLFLDADNVPARDPAYMFESKAFVDTGAVFWPAFWHPGPTIFNIHGQSLLWEVLGTPFVNSFKQESGQLLINRRRHAAPLDLVKFYTFHRPNPFTRLKLAYGDKDLFRFAWMKRSVPFTMIQTPPSVAGKVIKGSFCGMTMVQHGVQGEVLFLHRNSNKLTGEVKRKIVYHRAQAIKNVREKLLKEGFNHFPDQQVIADEMTRLRLKPAPTLEPLEPDGSTSLNQAIMINF